MEKIDRKEFLEQAAKSLISEPDSSKQYPYIDPSNKTLPIDLQKTSSGLTPYAGAWTDVQMMHLLRRTLFGVSKSDYDFFKSKTMIQSVDYLLTVPTVAPSPPLNHYSLNNSNLADADVPYGQTWVNAAANPNLEFPRIQSLKYWWVGLMINQDKNILEKMTLFWHNHFSTETNTVVDSRYLYKHHALLRSMALGNFKELVKQVSIDPAMLTYLNGETNTKTSPNENYARELQELFTIGKFLAVHYSEDDVKQAAKVLSGWRNNRVGISSFFDSTKHDSTNKTFSAFYNNTLITGKTGINAGMDELNDLLSMLFSQAELAKNICRKLYRYFVYYVIDDTIETNIITPLATLFRNNNYDIKPVLNALLKSEHFYDSLNMACMIKQPMDHVIGLARQTNLTFPAAAGNTQQLYFQWQFMQQYGLILNQDIGDPPNVAGWPAFYESPQYYELWINSDSLPKRNTLCDYLIYVGYTRLNYKLIIDCIGFVSQFSTPGIPDALIDQLTGLIYPVSLSSTAKTFIKTSFLLSGQNADHYWTDAWNAYVANPTDAAAKSTVNTRLQALLKYLMGQAEYQLC